MTWTTAITQVFSQQRGFALGLVLSGTGTLRCDSNSADRLGSRDLGLARRLCRARRITAHGCRPWVWWLFKLPKDGESLKIHRLMLTEPEPVVEEGLTLGEALRGYRFWVLLLSIFLGLRGAIGSRAESHSGTH